jgi:hypothetical protein
MLIAQLSDPPICAPGLLCKEVADANQLFCDAIASICLGWTVNTIWC